MGFIDFEGITPCFTTWPESLDGQAVSVTGKNGQPLLHMVEGPRFTDGILPSAGFTRLAVETWYTHTNGAWRHYILVANVRKC